MNWTVIIIVALVFINILTFFLYGVDKWKAKRDKWRVSEAALIWMAVLGGSVGAWLGMKTWHHKTQHAKFKYGIPLILFAQVVVIAVLKYYFAIL